MRWANAGTLPTSELGPSSDDLPPLGKSTKACHFIRCSVVLASVTTPSAPEWVFRAWVVLSQAQTQQPPRPQNFCTTHRVMSHEGVRVVYRRRRATP